MARGTERRLGDLVSLEVVQIPPSLFHLFPERSPIVVLSQNLDGHVASVGDEPFWEVLSQPERDGSSANGVWRF